MAAQSDFSNPQVWAWFEGIGLSQASSFTLRSLRCERFLGRRSSCGIEDERPGVGRPYFINGLLIKDNKEEQ
jgi:hypothetical protein